MNKTFLGSVENNQPEQVELPGAAAGILPGNLLLRALDKFKKHDGADAGGFVYIAKEAPNNDVDTAYAADETVFAYRPKSGDYYRALVATGILTTLACAWLIVRRFRTRADTDGATVR